jgi:ABC-2 type transport system ATP-binding protein
MSDARNVITVDHVSKDFHLPHESNNSIKSAIVHAFKKKNKDYDTQHALKDISFTIKEGEFFGILGRNGSGKSTLLKILAEIYQPTSGEVKLDGKLVPFIELGVGFNPELTGRENVYLNGALLGFSRKEIDARYADIVAFAELEAFMDQKLKNYSSGMQVRLAFSVATRAKAEILLVDEVLAVGDASFQKKCYDYFKSLKKSGTTVVFVTHDMSAVREYCDRAILIEEGLITHEGAASDISKEYLKLFMDKKSDLVLNEKDRWGSGEVVFENITHTVSDDAITIDFELHNRSDKQFEKEIQVGFDIFNEDTLVGGNNSKYLKPYASGISMQPKQKIAYSFTMQNNLGNFDYQIHMNVRTAGGAAMSDEIKNAVILKTPNQKYVKFYRAILPATMTEKNA